MVDGTNDVARPDQVGEFAVFEGVFLDNEPVEGSQRSFIGFFIIKIEMFFCFAAGTDRSR